MQSIRFEFRGSHELLVPDGPVYNWCASEIIQGLSYPLPKHDLGPPVRTVVDLGAHAGEFTVMAALRWPQATIHAYEPNPHILPYLRHNCQNHNVVIHERAVDAAPRRDKLYMSTVGLACTILKPDQPPPAEHEYATVEIEIVGPETIEAHDPDVLKLDIEGSEYGVLSGMKNLAGIHRIYAEFHSEEIRRQIERLLQRTHSLHYARIARSHLGEVMYVRREDRPSRNDGRGLLRPDRPDCRAR